MDVLDIYASLKLDTDEYEAGLNEAEGKSKSFGSKVVSGLGKAAKKGLIAASGATVAFGASAVKAGAEFDSSMSQVAATMGTTVDEIGDLRDYAMEMGAKTAFSATQAADALNYMALAGYDADTSMSMLPNVLNLAAAGGMELASASDMITDSQSALGLTLEETSELVDKMARASSKSNTSVSQLGDAILTVGGTAKNLKGGTTELSTALGILADNGIKGSEGGTALRNIILALSAPTDKAASALEGLGVQIYDAEGNMRGLEDIFADLSNGLGELSQGDRINVLNDIFNKVDLKSANALLDTSSERWSELAGSIDDASGAAQQMADTQLDNLSGDITLFKSALEGTKIALSDELTPSLRDFVQIGTDGLTAITEGFKNGGIEGAFEGLGDFLGNIVNAIGKGLPKLVTAVSKVLSSLIKSLAKNLPQIVKDLLPALINGATELLGTLAEELPGLVVSLLDALSSSLIANVGTIIDSGMMIVEKLIDGIIDNLPKLVEVAFTMILNLVQGIVEKLPDILQKGKDIVLKLVRGIIDNLPEIINGAVQAVNTLITTITEHLPEILEAGIEILLELVSGITDAIPDLIAAVPKIITALFDNLVSLDNLGKILEAGEKILGKIVEGLLEFILNAPGYAWDIITSLFDAIGGVLWKALQIGKDIMNEIWKGLKEVFSGLIDWAKKAGEAIVDAINPFKSASSVTDMIESAKQKAGASSSSTSGGSSMYDPSARYKHYAKAMNSAYLLDGATIFGEMGGSLLEGGERGQEMIVGTDYLAGMIKEAYREANQTGQDQKIIIPVYIGNERITEVVVDAQNRHNYITGGR